MDPRNMANPRNKSHYKVLDPEAGKEIKTLIRQSRRSNSSVGRGAGTAENEDEASKADTRNSYRSWYGALLVYRRAILIGSLLALLVLVTCVHNSSGWKPSAHRKDRGGVMSYPAISSKFQFDPDQPLPPIQVLEQYKQWHSVDALRKDPDNRKFVVNSYACPNQAGNRLHTFMNRFIYAILTNRTMLWQYLPQDECIENENGQATDADGGMCHVNHVEDCDASIEREPWMPSYDEWTKTLKLKKTRSLPFATGEGSAVAVSEGSMDRDGVHWKHLPDEKFVLDIDPDDQVVTIPRIHNIMFWMKDEKVLRTHLSTDYARSASEKLVSLGLEFFYGALFEYSFSFSDGILASVGLGPNGDPALSEPVPSEDDYTVAIHTRHPREVLEGCDIFREQQCLNAVLDHPKSVGKKCFVYIMSDRECTLSELQKWLQDDKGCEGIVAPHEQSEGKFIEHGPFAGAGYFQDLALATTRAKSAVVGTLRLGGRLGDPNWRSSSNMLRELIEYNTKMDAWRAGKNPAAKEQQLESCVMFLPDWEGDGHFHFGTNS